MSFTFIRKIFSKDSRVSAVLKPLGRASRFVWVWCLLLLRFFTGIGLFLVVIFSCLLFTSSGSEFLLGQVKKLDDNIRFDYVSGHFGHGFVLDNVSVAIPEVLTLEASHLEIDYSLLSLLRGHFDVRTLDASNVLLVLGQKPEKMPDIVQFLVSRLREVRSFAYDEETGAMKRVAPVENDPTLSIAPQVWPAQEEPAALLEDRTISKDAEGSNVIASTGSSSSSDANGEADVNANSSADLKKPEAVLGTLTVLDDKNATASVITNNAKDAKTAVETVVAQAENTPKAEEKSRSSHKGHEGELKVADIARYRRHLNDAMAFAPGKDELVRVGNMQNGGPDGKYEPNAQDTPLAKENRGYEEAEKVTKISIPVIINLKNVNVHNFLMLMDSVDVAFEQAHIVATMNGSAIILKSGQVSFIDIALHNERFTDDGPAPDPALQSTAFKNPFDRQAMLQGTGMLPTVILPFDSVVEKLDINNLRYHQVGYETGVMRGQLVGSFRGTRVHVNKFAVDHELGHAELNDSEMYLTRYYPMHVHLSGSSSCQDYAGALAAHTLEAEGEGDLADLYVDATLTGVGANKDSIKAQARLGALTSDLPFIAHAVINKAGFPFEKPEYQLSKAELNARGTLNGLSFKLSGNGLLADGFPAMNLEAEGSTDLTQAELAKLKISGGKDEVNYQGLVSWMDGILSQGKLEAKLSDLSRYQNNISGSIQFNTEHKLSFFGVDDWAVDVSHLTGSGTYMGSRLALSSGHIALNQRFEGKIEDLRLESGKNNRISINGLMDKTINVRAALALGSLEGLWPELGGNLNGSIGVRGTYESPVASVHLNSDRIAYGANRIREIKLDLEAQTRNLHLIASSLRASVGRVSVDRETMVNSLSLDFAGSERKHELFANALTAWGSVNLALEGGLNQERTQYEGTLQKLDYNRSGLSAALYSGGRFALDFANALKVNVEQTVWQANGNDIRLGELAWSGRDASGTLTAKAFDVMKFQSFLPLGLELSRPVSLNADFGMTRGVPHADVEVMMPKGHIMYNRQALHYKTIKATVGLKDEHLSTGFMLDLGKRGSAESAIELTDLSGSKNLDGSVKINNLDLGIISIFANEVSSSDGVLAGEIRLAGTTAKPQLFGGLNIENMNVTTALDLGTIEKINTAMTFAGTRADILSSFYMKDKRGSVDGYVAWEPEPEAKINLKTERLPVNLMGYGTGQIELDVSGMFTNGITKIAGAVSIPTARVKVKTLPESSVSVSSDVVKIEKAENGTYRINKHEALPVDLRLKVNIGPDFNINAMGLRTDVEGSLSLRQKPGSYMTAKGTINLNDGRFHAYGQNLIIEKGRISFVGDLENPGLEVRAIRDPHAMEDDNITVGVNITGTARAPRVKLFSEPTLSQSEMLSYLMRGRGMDQTTEGNSSMSTQLLLGVGLMETSGFVGDLAEKMGISDFSLDSRGDGEDTSVEVSGYIMPKVQVAYGYGIYNALSEFRVRYEMFPRFFIEYASSLEQAVDAIYKFEF